MQNAHRSYRPPYGRGDFRLVTATGEGTYWSCPQGIVVRMASGEHEAARQSSPAPAWNFAGLALALAVRLARA